MAKNTSLAFAAVVRLPFFSFFFLSNFSFSSFLRFSSWCALVLTILHFFRYETGPVRDDSSSASTLQSPIVAADPLDQKQPPL
jgi:hypothetical protein